jgi:hypothetical protein
MRSVWTAGTAALLLGLVVVCGRVRGDEEKVSPGQMPKAVAKAVKKRFPGAELLGAGKEGEDGKTLYEVALKHEGQKIDVTLTPKGKIQEIEKEIAAKKLPKAVSKALKAKYGKAKVKKAEALIKVEDDGEEELHAYEVVLVTKEGQTLEVVLSPNGKITKVEKKGEAEEENEKKGKKKDDDDDDEKEVKGKKGKKNKKEKEDDD